MSWDRMTQSGEPAPPFVNKSPMFVRMFSPFPPKRMMEAHEIEEVLTTNPATKERFHVGHVEEDGSFVPLPEIDSQVYVPKHAQYALQLLKLVHFMSQNPKFVRRMVSKPRHYFIAEKDAEGNPKPFSSDVRMPTVLREDAVDETGKATGRTWKLDRLDNNYSGKMLKFMLESDVCLDNRIIEGISIMNAFDGFPNDMPVKIPEQLSRVEEAGLSESEKALMNGKLESFLDYNNIKGESKANYVVLAFDKKESTLRYCIPAQAVARVDPSVFVEKNGELKFAATFGLQPGSGSILGTRSANEYDFPFVPGTDHWLCIEPSRQIVVERFVLDDEGKKVTFMKDGERKEKKEKADDGYNQPLTRPYAVSVSSREMKLQYDDNGPAFEMIGPSLLGRMGQVFGF